MRPSSANSRRGLRLPRLVAPPRCENCAAESGLSTCNFTWICVREVTMVGDLRSPKFKTRSLTLHFSLHISLLLSVSLCLSVPHLSLHLSHSSFLTFLSTLLSISLSPLTLSLCLSAPFHSSPFSLHISLFTSTRLSVSFSVPSISVCFCIFFSPHQTCVAS